MYDGSRAAGEHHDYTGDAMALSMIERAMAIKIKPSDIKFLVKEVEKLHGTDVSKGFETQAFILMKRYGKNKSAKIFAILERMHCLLALMEDERMRGWTLESQEPGCTLTHEAVFDATATCRLLDRDGHFAFDPDEFFELALKHTPAKTHA